MVAPWIRACTDHDDMAFIGDTDEDGYFDGLVQRDGGRRRTLPADADSTASAT
jgi:hypothetical protein